MLRLCTGVLLSLSLGVAIACATDKAASETKPAKEEPVAQKAADAPPPTLNQLERQQFNSLAALHAFPMFWFEDKNVNQTLEPEELVHLWGMDTGRTGPFVDSGAFTPTFFAAYAELVAAKDVAPPSGNDPEQLRAAAVYKELSQGRPTAVHADFSQASAEDRALVSKLLEVAQRVELLHLKQGGAFGMKEQIPSGDWPSRTLFHRNQGPWCEAPATEADPNCNALASKPPKVVSVYPADMQADKKFCEVLSSDKDQKALMDPFTVVQRDAQGKLVAVPYNTAFKDDVEAISAMLKDAAGIVQDPKEAPLKAYLLAAAQSFVDNQWTPADEAWAKMNATNSKWYLRVGADEVYWEPCSRKAGFHVAFARINPGSLAWQQKLDPVKTDMEKEMAKLSGGAYKARNVSFHLPDFIDVIANAGDSRAASGATVGQSLPNWGPVANEGRGRTVVMVNFYTDPDSKRAFKEQVESVLCVPSMETFTSDDGPQIMSTVLHEAAHNLGPAHEYKVKGKADGEVFGGPMASVLEELKAQTSALYFATWLVEKKLITAEEATRAHTRDVTWAFGHISRGMYQDGKPKPYSQLAAIQLGHLMKEGATEWKSEELAANGKDKGCLLLHAGKFGDAVKKLQMTVVGIKAKGDKKGAEALRTQFVDAEGPWKNIMGTITERWLRSPKATFVYSVKL